MSAKNQEVGHPLELLLEKSPLMLAMFDAAGICLVATEKWAQHWGVVREAVIGARHQDVTSATPDEWLELFEKGMVGQTGLCHELQVEGNCGSAQWFRCEVEPWQDDTTNGIVVTLKNVTDQHSTNAASVRDPQQQVEFLANAARDICTPLSSIIGFTEIILNERRVERIHRNARTVLRESDELLAIVNDLMDYAKIEAGRMAIERQSIDLRVWLEKCVQSMRVPAQEKSVGLICDYERQLYRFRFGDRSRLRQIIRNLIDCAITFTRGDAISISAKTPEKPESENEILFEVRSNGMQIPKDVQAAIFQKYDEHNEDNTRKLGSTGLGMSIARELVELMGGKIGIENKDGSCLWFRVSLENCTEVSLLAMKSTACADYKQIIPNGSRRAANILVAEDHPANQKVISHHLESIGHYVTVVENGRKAVDMCMENEYDLILMDCSMPVLDGFEASREIRRLGDEHNLEVPIIAITASSDQETRHECEAAGMNEILTKPLRRDPFLHTIDAWLQETQITSDEDMTVSGVLMSPEMILGTAFCPLNYDIAVAEFEDDRDLVNQAVSEFIDAMEIQIPLLKKALEAENLEAVAVEAHRARRTAEYLAAKPFAETASILQKACQRHKPEEASDALISFVHEFQRLKNYVYQQTRD